MRFTFAGTYGDRAVSGEWTPGRIRSYPPELADDARAVARARADVAVAGFGGGPANLREWIPAMGIVIRLMPAATFPELDIPSDPLAPSAVP